MTSKHDVVGLQRAVVELVTDDDARVAWMSGPGKFAAERLCGPAAEVLAGIDPAGIQAMTMSHVAKKARFDQLHRLHHELEARKAAEAAERAATHPAGHTAAHPAGGHHHHGGDGHGGHAHPHGEHP